jgi:hypothetical protein
VDRDEQREESIAATDELLADYLASDDLAGQRHFGRY